MAFIKYIPEDQIPEKDRVADKDNILRIHTVHSKVMRQHYELYLEIMRRKSPLSRIQREMIAVLVSSLNHCHYWTVHHGAGLRKLLEKDGMADAEQDALVAALCEDYQKATLSPEDLAMLRYTEKLTLTPGKIIGEDVVALRTAGFDERGIHDICSIVAYFAFVNRIAGGLGVELEPRFE